MVRSRKILASVGLFGIQADTYSPEPQKKALTGDF